MCRPAMTVRIRDLIRSNRLFAAILGLALLLRVWQPAVKWRYTHDEDLVAGGEAPLDRRAVTSAWVPWVLLTVFVFAWGLPALKEALKEAKKLIAYEKQLLEQHETIEASRKAEVA